jgi:hypothetical protein
VEFVERVAQAPSLAAADAIPFTDRFADPQCVPRSDVDTLTDSGDDSSVDAVHQDLQPVAHAHDEHVDANPVIVERRTAAERANRILPEFVDQRGAGRDDAQGVLRSDAHHEGDRPRRRSHQW